MSKKVTWNFQVPKPMDDAVEKAVEMDMHSTKAEFIRDAVRQQLKNMGIEPKVKGKVEKHGER